LAGSAFIDTLPRYLKEVKSTLDIIQYSWHWYKFKENSSVTKLSRAVLDAPRRGVKVRILLNKEWPGSPLTGINLESKKYLEEAGCVVKFGPSFPITHAKLWLLDENLTVLGSHNLSERSVLHNDETSVLMDSRLVQKYYKDYFNLLWARF
jgi:phosphatidylserine/phosphatidylglycerophosphate/cardiolipin synthase-like enzyme